MTTTSSIELSFISLKESSHLLVRSEAKIWEELLLLFKHTFYSERNNYELEAIQQNTAALRERLGRFTNKVRDQFPGAQELNAFFRRMPDGHYFAVVAGAITDTRLINEYYTYLIGFHQSKNIPVDCWLLSMDFGSLLLHYDMRFFGHQRKAIGTGKRSERRCRFCGCQAGEQNDFGETVIFHSKAHAISEALGNKLVTILEECDSCNSRFSRTIEPSIAGIFAFFRALHNLKGKAGSKTITGKNFKLKPDPDIFKMDVYEEVDLTQGTNVQLLLQSNEIFVPQDFYRCLVKFVLSVIDTSDLPAFQKTIQWVNGLFDARSLPKIAYLQDADFFSKEPMLIVFRRKSEGSNPFMIGEFHYADQCLHFNCSLLQRG